jgi:protein-tyrosine phosphatase
MDSVIFVCLGNICRSPIAEGCARKIVQQNNLNIKVDSAGTGDWHVGETPCENSIQISMENGVDISDLRARQITKDDLVKFDLIVALDDNNYRDLKLMGAKNIVKLGDFGYDGVDIPDPYFFQGFDGFDEVFKMIDVCVKNMFEDKI